MILDFLKRSCFEFPDTIFLFGFMLLLVMLLSCFRGEIDDFRYTGWTVSRVMVALPQGIPIVWGPKGSLGMTFGAYPTCPDLPQGLYQSPAQGEIPDQIWNLTLR